jgi:hypothetical protein
MDPAILNVIANILEHVPLHTVLTEILERPDLKSSAAHTAIVHGTRAIAHVLFENAATQSTMQEIAFDVCQRSLMSEISRMAKRESGWHFSARKASPTQIDGFSIADMSGELKDQTPCLWQMLTALLVSDPGCESQRVRYIQKETSMGPSEMMVDTETPQTSQTWDDEDEYWACDADGELEGSEGDDDGDGEHKRPTKRARRASTRNSNLVQVVSEYSTIN